jgi:hypothetical protein
MGTTYTTRGIPRRWLGKLSWIESVRSQPPSSATPSAAPLGLNSFLASPPDRHVLTEPLDIERALHDLWSTVVCQPKTLVVSQRTAAMVVYWQWRGTWFGRITRASGFGFIAALYAAALVKGLR